MKSRLPRSGVIAVLALLVLSSAACGPAIVMGRRNDVGVAVAGVGELAENDYCSSGPYDSVDPRCRKADTKSSASIEATYHRSILEESSGIGRLLAGVAIVAVPGLHPFPDATGQVRHQSLFSVMPTFTARGDGRVVAEIEGGVGATRFGEANFSYWTLTACAYAGFGYNFSPLVGVVGGPRFCWYGRRPSNAGADLPNTQLISVGLGVRVHF